MDQLHSTLMSLPPPIGMLNQGWGHTSGGIFTPDGGDGIPWNWCMFKLSERDESDQGNAAPCNPFRIPRTGERIPSPGCLPRSSAW